MDVRLPDGTIVRGVPENISKAELVAKLQRNGMQVPQEWLQPQGSVNAAAANQAPASQPINAPGGSLNDRLLRGIANAGAGALRGAGSIGATLLAPVDAAARALNDGKPVEIGGVPVLGIERRQAMTDALGSLGSDTNSLAFGAGKLGAEIAGTLGVGGALANTAVRAAGALASGAPSVASSLAGRLPAGLADAVATAGMRGGNLATRTAGGAITGGASAGLVDPNQAAAGSMIGAALPGALKVAGAAGSSIGSQISPRAANPGLAAKAVDHYGIPLAIGDVTGSRFLRAAQSVLNDAPLTAGMGQKHGNAIQQAFNREVGRTFGAPSASLTPDVLDAAKGKIGAELDRIWGGNNVVVDQPFMQSLRQLMGEVDKLPQGEGARLRSWIDDLASKAKRGPNGYEIPGDVANNFQSKIRAESEKATGFLKDNLGTLRRSIIDAFNRNVSPSDAQALSKAMGQYKAFKTVQPLLQSAEAGVAGRAVGDIPAGLLPNAVRQGYRGGISNSPFADLSQIGSQYLVNRSPQTGGSLRAMIQNGMLGGAAIANPLAVAAGIPIAVGAQGALTSPALVRASLRQPSANPILQLMQARAGELGYQAAPVGILGAP